jgi:hypothetical protein
MAGDHVTPTPPDPSADLTLREPAAPPEQTDLQPLRRPSRAGDEEPHAFRFRMAYALFAVVLGAVVGGFIVLLGRGGDSAPNQTWSSWQPQGSAFDKARQIGAHVAFQYRLPSGRELVAVIPHAPPEVQASTQAVPITHIALAQGSRGEDLSVVSTENSIEYVLCGVGPQSSRCAISEGKPTVERARLLHRESLELALYTFKYVDGVDSVVTLQPPRVGQQPTFTLFFRKDDFDQELTRPLRETLPGISPFTAAAFPIPEQAEVAQLVSPHLFQYQYTQAPDGSALMYLTPPAL